jgi:hypothetical protein
MLRLWVEALGGRETELRGVALHVRTGARITFRDWLALRVFIVEQIGGADVPPLQSWSGDGSEVPDE